MQLENTFELNTGNPIKTFNLSESLPYITIKKIIIGSLFGQKPDEWFSNLMKSNPYLRIKCVKESGEILEYPVLIASLVTPNHYQPVFDFSDDFIIPEQNRINQRSIFKNYNRTSIELCFYDKIDLEFKLTFLYQ